MTWLVLLVLLMGCDSRIINRAQLDGLMAEQSKSAADRATFSSRLSSMEAKVGPVVDRLNEQNKNLENLTNIIKDRMPVTTNLPPVTPLPTPTTKWPTFSSTPLPGGNR